MKNLRFLAILTMSLSLYMTNINAKASESLHICASKEPTFRILCIHGGGEKGIIPLHVLSRIEKETNYNMTRLFHLIAGTSVGGIISLMLTKPDPKNKKEPLYQASDFEDAFLKSSLHYFKPDLFSFFGLLKPMFNRDNFEDFLNKTLGSTPISETTTGCLVTTVDEKTNDAYFFYKFPNENWPQTKEDYSRKNLAMATSAIPYVFGPCAVKSLDNPMKKFSGVDGSLCMVDPSLEAYAVASKILKGYDKRIPIEMVTITCGHADDKATKRTDPLTKFLWPYLESDMKENRKLLKFMDVKNTYIDVPLSNAYAPMYTMIFSTEAMQKDLIKQTDKYLDNCAAFQKLVKKLKVEKTDFDSL